MQSNLLSLDEAAQTIGVSRKKLAAYIGALDVQKQRLDGKCQYVAAHDVQRMQQFHTMSEKANPAWQGLIAYSDSPQPVTMPRDYKAYVKEAYGQNDTIYKCVKYLTQNGAAIPPVLYVDDSMQKKIDKHPVLDKLKAPNEDESGVDYREAVLGYFLLAGNSFQLALRKGTSGPPDELWTLQPNRVEVIGAKTRGIVSYKYLDYPDSMNPIPKQNMAHMKFWNPDSPVYGMSPLQVGAIIVDQQTASYKWNLGLLQNWARLPGAWTTPTILSQNDRQKLEARLNEKFAGARGAGKFPLLDGGFTWTQIGASPTEMDWLQSIIHNAGVLANLYDIPPQLIGDTSASTYNNIQEAKAAAYTEAIFPMLDKFYAKLNTWLLPMYSDLKGAYLYYDKTTVEVVQAVIQQRLTAASQRGNASYMQGVAMLDEAREMQGLPPLPNSAGQVFRLGAVLVRAEDMVKYAEQSLTKPAAPPIAAPEPIQLTPGDPSNPPDSDPSSQDEQDQEKPANGGKKPKKPVQDEKDEQENTKQKSSRHFVKADDDEEHTGVMVAFFLDSKSAKKLAISGGEPASDLHVTLAYLGDKDDLDLDVPALKQALDTFASEETPLTGRIAGIRKFDAPEGQSIPIIALPDIPGLPAFRQKLIDLLDEQGCSANDEHGYTPHITLAYIDPDDSAPIDDVAHFDLTFDTLCLAIGDKRYSFALGEAQKRYGPINRRYLDTGNYRRTNVPVVAHQPKNGTFRNTKALDLTTAESKTAYFKQMESARSRWDDEAEKRIADYFKTEHKAMVQAIENHSHEYDYGATISNVLEAHKSKFTKVLRGLYEDVVEDIGGEVYKAFPQPEKHLDTYRYATKATPLPNLLSAQTVAYLVQFAGLRVKQINLVTLGLLQDALAEGVSKGESIPQLAKRVDQLYLQQIIPNRSTTIARTEVVSSSNVAAMQSGKQYMADTGLQLTKVWLATDDSRTRPAHAAVDGQEVGFDEPFDVGGEELQQPGDSNGSAAMTVNCRCTVYFNRVKASQDDTSDNGDDEGETEKRRRRHEAKQEYQKFMEEVLV